MFAYESGKRATPFNREKGSLIRLVLGARLPSPASAGGLRHNSPVNTAQCETSLAIDVGGV